MSPAENVASRWLQPFQLVITIHYSPEEISLDHSPLYATTRHECVYYEHEPSSIDRFKCAVGGKNRYPWRSYNLTLLTYESNLHELHDELITNHTGSFTGQEDALIYFCPHTALPGTFRRIHKAGNTHIHKTHACLLPNHMVYAFSAEQTQEMARRGTRCATSFQHGKIKGRFEEYDLRAATLPHPSYFGEGTVGGGACREEHKCLEH